MTDLTQNIFSLANELPFYERGLFLSKECGGDTRLRQEVEQLLCDAARDDSELQGDFPELEIISLIGRGGLGAVFKARHKSLDRLIALKVLPAKWNEKKNFRERFKRKAKALAALNHPNIVTIYDFGERNGRFFFTMEFVDGMDLGRLLKKGKAEQKFSLSLIPQICEAVQFAHSEGVVHQGIKPANILVSRDGVAKIADFGISKLKLNRGLQFKFDAKTGGLKRRKLEAGEVPDHDPELTDHYGMPDNPRYVVPGQQADLDALGVIFYEMLAGSPPKDGIQYLQAARNRRYQNATQIKIAAESALEENIPFARVAPVTQVSRSPG